MVTRRTHGDLIWIDLQAPTPSEVEKLVEEFDIDHLVAEELLLPTNKPRVEFHEHYLYTIFHFPALQHAHRTVEQEIDMVVGKDFLITTHYENMDALQAFSKLFEVNSILDDNPAHNHAGFLFFVIIKRLYQAVEHEVDFIKSDLANVENKLFSGHEVETVRHISRISRDLLNIRQIIEPHRDVLKDMETKGADFFGGDFSPCLKALSNEYYRVHNHVMRNTEVIQELRETNNSLLTTKEGETMRVLTIMALMTFPLALLVSIFNIDTDHNPIKGLPYDFWIIVGIVVALGASMIMYFKKRGWL